MTSARTNLVMTVIGSAVSTLFIVFICTRLICARIQLRSSRRNHHRLMASRSNLAAFEQGLDGIEPAIAANFPKKKYSDEYFSSVENGQCSICLVEYKEEDLLRILPYCGHYFHINCIDIWLLQHCTCPVCRVSLCESNERNDPCRMDPIEEDQVLSEVGTEDSGNSSLSLEDNICSEACTNKNVDGPSLCIVVGPIYQLYIVNLPCYHGWERHIQRNFCGKAWIFGGWFFSSCGLWL